MGVNTHFANQEPYIGGAAQWKADMKYLGITLIRDQLSAAVGKVLDWNQVMSIPGDEIVMGVPYTLNSIRGDVLDPAHSFSHTGLASFSLSRG